MKTDAARFNLKTVSVIATFVAFACFVSGAAADGRSHKANHLSCGETITTDTKLRSDLVNCPNNGIVIGADDITLDLNGHVIDGNGTEVAFCPPDEPCDLGVADFDHHGVTIKGGTIREFVFGAFVVGASDSRFTRLTASNNLWSGLLVAESSDSEISRMTVSANGLTTDQAGVDVFDSHDLEIENNAVFGNGDIGFYIIGLEDSRIERNSISHNPETAILLEGNGNVLSRNRVFENGDNVAFTGNDNRVTRNDIADSVGFGIAVDGGDRNLVQGNDIDGAGLDGIRVTAFDPGLTGEAKDNVIRGNEVERTQLDGILVDETAPGSLLKGNIVVRADDDGIDVESPATTLTGNRALRNGDLGIEAVVGVTDGGGNTAFGNGNALQCLNVSCK